MKIIKSGQSFNGEMDDEEMEIRRKQAELVTMFSYHF